MDGRCKRLAQLHSSAVDFPKTGQAADFTDQLRVFRFPDFMAKENKPMYKSKKVLGQMFRQIDKADYDGYESKLVDETFFWYNNACDKARFSNTIEKGVKEGRAGWKAGDSANQ